MDTLIEERAEYAELQCRTNSSFLIGGSHPHELVERAHELGLKALAVTDLNGVYGMPKAYRAVKQLGGGGLKLIVGAELTLSVGQQVDFLPPAPEVKEAVSSESQFGLTLLARDRRGYGLLCRMLTASHEGKEKGYAALEWNEFLAHMQLPGGDGLIALPNSGAGVVLDKRSIFPVESTETLRELFGRERFFISLSRFIDGLDDRRTQDALALSRKLDARIVATNDVHYHQPSRRKMQDVLTAIRHGCSLNEAGTRLHSNAERYLKSPRQMAALFRDLPQALRTTIDIAEQCVFSPAELRYRYPSEWIPAGETAASYLRRLVTDGARGRYPRGVPRDVDAQLEHELKLIDQLGYSDYFLTIWEIVAFAKERKILCQGRGSAANSVVCFCLGITAVDPVRMNLLFERFISVERGEPPDIDVDFEHERREEVIQHVYEKYGRDRAAMVAAVITYRSRSAIREVSKALGVDLDEAKKGDTPAAQTTQALARELYGFPRHLSIHSGGFTLSADPIIETVPVEPARMPGRTIVQWDKDDLDSIGLLKVDLLSLGMLSAIRKTCDMVGLTLATIPAEDPKTYAMVQRADTVGVFQIESRAQMNMLGRLQPANFYDMVVQVAIVRPGPIVGKMVHPYLRRRRGLEPVDVPHPLLKPILNKTLGVPLFQEQVMKMAVALAGFTPGEADELRRAIGAWRSSGSIEKVGARLRTGLLASGLPPEYVARIFEQIKGFSEYGFPESHAASFALLAYASSYLKCHHPAEFACALINSQPMGFYSNHTIVDDAKRHGVRVLAIDPNESDWDCVARDGELRLGLRVVSGISKKEAESWIAERKRRPFMSLNDFLSRVHARALILHRLAMGDAFVGFGLDQRTALWRILGHDVLARPEPGGQLQFDWTPSARGYAEELCEQAHFEGLSTYDAIREDYTSYGLSTRGHPMMVLRSTIGPQERRLPKTTTVGARACRHGEAFTCAGMVIVRQRPPTAAGTVFATLEDETGLLDLILHKPTHEKYRELFEHHSFLIAKGTVQKDGHSVSLLVRSLIPVWRDPENHVSVDVVLGPSLQYRLG